jgi:hypothetical protein
MKTLTLTEKALVAVSAALIMTIAVIAHYAIAEKKALASAALNAKVQDGIIAKANAAIKDLQGRMDARDAADAKAQKGFQDESAAIKTPAQAVTRLKSTGAQVVTLDTRDVPDKIKKALPDPDGAGYVLMTAQTSVDLARLTVDLQAARARIVTLTADNADLRAQLAQAKTAQDAAQNKSKGWQTAAKGGSWARRTLSAGKWAATGGLIVYVAIKVLGKK